MRAAAVHRRIIAIRPAAIASRRTSPGEPSPASTIRFATAADAAAIHELVADHLAEGHLLPRSASDIAAHIDRFVVAIAGERVVGCADLAPLSRTAAEVRSLVVASDARGRGTGRRIVDELVRGAAAAGFQKLCAFTHSPRYFVQMGFSIVPHAWVPEKIDKDCAGCVHFRQCGQYAVVLPLGRAPRARVPLSSLHG